MNNFPTHIFNPSHASQPLTDCLELLLLSDPVHSLRIADKVVLILCFTDIYWLSVSREEITAGFFRSKEDAVNFAHAVLPLSLK